MAEGSHLLVQAGTGTGKSLAYLVPALLHGEPVVVATATIALQNQVVDRDLPALVDAVEPLLGRRPTYAILKGRSNYLCRNKLHGGMPDDDGEALFDPSPTTPLGRDVVRLRDWSDETETGDRDELDPGVSDRAWRQVSVTARECLGAAKCPYGAECFAELARDRAAEVEIVVTNHAMLAIDALESFALLPEHDVVVVDEAHELVDRVTGVATDELTAPMVERAASRRVALVDGTEDLHRRGRGARGGARGPCPRGAWSRLPEQLATAVVARARRGARTSCPSSSRAKQADDGARKMAHAAVDAVHDTAERVAAHSPYDVAWVSRDPRRGAVLRVAPLSVNGSAARGAVRRAVGGPHQRDPGGRRQLRGRRPTGRPRPVTRRRTGPGWTSGRRSTTPGRRSSTSRGDCRRRDGTARRRRPWTSSPRWSRRPAAAPSGCSPRCGPPRPRPPRCASGSTCRSSARARSAPPRWSRRSRPTRRPACSARSRSGRAWTSRATPAGWW